MYVAIMGERDVGARDVHAEKVRFDDRLPLFFCFSHHDLRQNGARRSVFCLCTACLFQTCALQCHVFSPLPFQIITQFLELSAERCAAVGRQLLHQVAHVAVHLAQGRLGAGSVLWQRRLPLALPIFPLALVAHVLRRQ